MTNETELKRLEEIEKRIKEIAVEEFGLLTTDIVFEVVSSQKMLEGSAYGFPENFSYWQFGRDYDRERTIYEHTGGGVAYEQVWNFDRPRALIAETNPFSLKVATIAHVYGHVDFFLGNRFLRQGRSVSDIATEARRAADRFQEYENLHGIESLEKIMDAADAICWHQPLDPFADEDIPEDELREQILERERAKLERGKDLLSEFSEPPSRKQIMETEECLRRISRQTPPLPMYDLLLYILRHSHRPLRPWEEDVLSVMREQARHLAPQRRTKLLDEGWATYWHVRIMRRLFQEKLLTDKEHASYVRFHAGVVTENRKTLNPYRVGYALFENIKERWDRGQFGRDYKECRDAYQKSHWDTGANMGNQKIFEVRSSYSDRMAVEEFFTDEFLREQRLYIYQEESDQYTGEIVEKIAEDRPEVIREILKLSYTLYGLPIIKVEDGNHNEAGELLLSHQFQGSLVEALPHLELNPSGWREQTMEFIYLLWGRRVHLDTFLFVEPEKNKEDKNIVKLIRFSYDGHKHSFEVYKEIALPPDAIRW